jgi:hypothetical protein
MSMPGYDSLLSFLNALFEWAVDNYIIVSVSLAVIAAAVVLVLRRRRGRGRLHKQGPVPPGDVAQKREMLMGIVRELEAEVNKIDIENSGDSERKWYNKVRLQIESIKRSIDGGDYRKARRHLNDAELYVRMLELHSAS